MVYHLSRYDSQLPSPIVICRLALLFAWQLVLYAYIHVACRIKVQLYLRGPYKALVVCQSLSPTVQCQCHVPIFSDKIDTIRCRMQDITSQAYCKGGGKDFLCADTSHKNLTNARLRIFISTPRKPSLFIHTHSVLRRQSTPTTTKSTPSTITPPKCLQQQVTDVSQNLALYATGLESLRLPGCVPQ